MLQFWGVCGAPVQRGLWYSSSRGGGSVVLQFWGVCGAPVQGVCCVQLFVTSGDSILGGVGAVGIELRASCLHRTLAHDGQTERHAPLSVCANCSEQRARRVAVCCS